MGLSVLEMSNGDHLDLTKCQLLEFSFFSLSTSLNSSFSLTITVWWYLMSIAYSCFFSVLKVNKICVDEMLT